MQETTTPILGMDVPGKFSRKENVSLVDGHIAFDKFCSYEGNFFEFFKFVKSKPQPFNGNPHGSTNANSFSRELYEGDCSFKGGTFDDLLNSHTDFTRYKNTINKISISKVWQKVVTSFGKALTRKRTRSAYDGEYDFDKRWDVEPFSQREKKPQTTRIVKVNVHAGFSASVSTSTINDFAAFVTAMINLFEQNGIQVELYVIYTGKGSLIGAGGSNAFQMKVKVKDSDQYMPIAQFLKIFSAVWYRRAKFSLIILCGEYMGYTVQDSLGSPYEWGKVWETQNKNEIHIYSVPSHEEQHKIIEKLLDLVGIEGATK